MGVIESLKEQYKNREISKEDFYSDVSSYLAKQTGSDHEKAVKEVVEMIGDLGLTRIQSNKIWTRAKVKHKMITNRGGDRYHTQR